MAAERSWKQAVIDAAPVALVLALCPLVATMAPGPAGPVERAGDLIGIERSLGLFFEPLVHVWVAARPLLLGAADFGTPPSTSGHVRGPGWVWAARRAAFLFVRNTSRWRRSCCWSPATCWCRTAPPRMVAALQYGRADAGLSGVDRLAMSPYAAMPSGHAAFAVLVAGILVALSRRPLVRAIALLYPVAVLLEIVGTGNHIWLTRSPARPPPGSASWPAERSRAAPRVACWSPRRASRRRSRRRRRSARDRAARPRPCRRTARASRRAGTASRRRDLRPVRQGRALELREGEEAPAEDLQPVPDLAQVVGDALGFGKLGGQAPASASRQACQARKPIFDGRKP